MSNFKNIIKTLENFSERHEQINEFGWGPISKISTNNQDFVLVWFLPTGARVEHSSTILIGNLYVMDLLKQNYENLLDIHNDTFQIGRDFISEFYDQEDLYGFVMNEVASAEPFDYMFDDHCAGWIFNIEIEYDSGLNTCLIPKDEEPKEPEEPPAPVYTFEGNLIDNSLTTDDFTIFYDSMRRRYTITFNTDTNLILFMLNGVEYTISTLSSTIYGIGVKLPFNPSIPDGLLQMNYEINNN